MKVLFGIVALSLLLVACGQAGNEYFDGASMFHVAQFGRLACSGQGLQYRTWEYYQDPITQKVDQSIPVIICTNQTRHSIADGVMVSE